MLFKRFFQLTRLPRFTLHPHLPVLVWVELTQKYFVDNAHYRLKFFQHRDVSPLCKYQCLLQTFATTTNRFAEFRVELSPRCLPKVRRKRTCWQRFNAIFVRRRIPSVCWSDVSEVGCWLGELALGAVRMCVRSDTIRVVCLWGEDQKGE